MFEKRNKVIAAAKRRNPERWGSRESKKYEPSLTEVLNQARVDVA
jgi:hypothetical protein